MAKVRTRLIVGLCLALTVLSAGLSHAEPLGTVFTYQGRLIDANHPAQGIYDFVFELYDDPNTAKLIGDPFAVNALDVNDGYFTIELDFGAGIFDGNDRWLLIGIRPGDMNDPNEYVFLQPLQRITPAPYAMHAASTSETDPVYGTSSAAGITAGNITNWDTAYSWGDHALAGYLKIETDPTVNLGKLKSLVSNDFHNLGGVDQVGITAESDPVYLASTAAGISGADIANWNSAFVWGDHSTAGYLTFETDPVYGGAPASGITLGNITNWNTTFGWGNHALAGYLKTETDPSVLASVKDGISWSEVSNRPAGLDDGDDVGISVETDPTVNLSKLQVLVSNDFHNLGGADDVTTDPEIAAMGYIKSYTETDPTVPGSIKDGITWTEVANRPAGLDDGDQVGITSETDPTVTASVKDGVAWGELSSIPAGFADGVDDTGITSETDPTVPSSVKDGITWSEVSNRPPGLDDGDQVGITTETDPVYVGSPAFGITSSNITNWNTAYGWGDHTLAGYLTSYAETDPVYGTSPASGITPGIIANWNAAFGWGDHSTAGYLTAPNDFGRSGAAATLYEGTTALSAKYLGISAKAADSDLLDGQHGSYYRNWGNLTNVPAGFADGVDNGITSETDPEVGVITPNYIPKWNGSALVSGTIYDNGSIGIGTSSPLARLHVEEIGAAVPFQVRVSASTKLIVTNSGNVGIGTTNPGTNKLQVTGGPLEVTGGPIKATGGFIVEIRPDDPPSPVQGQIWLRTDL